MDLWRLMIRKDDLICKLIDTALLFKSYLSIKRQILLHSSKNQPTTQSDKDVVIILNGPSVKEQDLSVIKDKTIMFVNRGFKHSLYKELRPAYHVFIDPKMLSGEWPVTWLDEILEVNPDVTFIMPISWAFIDQFQPYIKRGVNFHWIEDYSKCFFLGVAGAAFEFSIKSKFKNIYFTGFDATGLAHEMLNTSSHFYGINEENLKKNTKNYVQDLFMFSRHLNDLNRFAARCKKKNINIYNITKGGLLDMFERKNMSEI